MARYRPAFGSGVSQPPASPDLTPREIRFVVVSDDYEALAGLFRDTMGLEVFRDLDHQGGRGVILRLPETTLEVIDREHAAMVDEVETGARFDDRLRIAVRVDDLDQAMTVITKAGARPVADTVDAPWGDRNRRYTAGDGIQLTLFETG
jgi:hypothetical protein